MRIVHSVPPQSGASSAGDTVEKEVPPRVEYCLTAVGHELIPFINHLRDWGVQQMTKENIPMIGDKNCAIP